jgi:hypothetical protein
MPDPLLCAAKHGSEYNQGRDRQLSTSADLKRERRTRGRGHECSERVTNDDGHAARLTMVCSVHLIPMQGCAADPQLRYSCLRCLSSAESEQLRHGRRRDLRDAAHGPRCKHTSAVPFDLSQRRCGHLRTRCPRSCCIGDARRSGSGPFDARVLHSAGVGRKGRLHLCSAAQRSARSGAARSPQFESESECLSRRVARRWRGHFAAGAEAASHRRRPRGREALQLRHKGSGESGPGSGRPHRSGTIHGDVCAGTAVCCSHARRRHVAPTPAGRRQGVETGEEGTAEDAALR